MSSFEISQRPVACAPPIGALYDYWRSVHPAGALPGRQHIDPMAIPSLLPHLWMLDVQRNPLRFRFRLIGTMIVKFTGRDSTGLWYDEVYPDFAASDGFPGLTACALDGRPQYRSGPVSSIPDRGHVTAERLYLPLAKDGQLVDVLLNMTFYREQYNTPPR